MNGFVENSTTLTSLAKERERRARKKGFICRSSDAAAPDLRMVPGESRIHLGAGRFAIDVSSRAADDGASCSTPPALACGSSDHSATQDANRNAGLNAFGHRHTFRS